MMQGKNAARHKTPKCWRKNMLRPTNSYEHWLAIYISTTWCFTKA